MTPVEEIKLISIRYYPKLEANMGKCPYCGHKQSISDDERTKNNDIIDCVHCDKKFKVKTRIMRYKRF